MTEEGSPRRSVAEAQRVILDRAGGDWFDLEQLVREVYLDVIKPGDWALDVGASRGSHLFQMAPRVAPGGRVIAIEAAPGNAAALEYDLAHHYRFLADQVVLVKAGAFDRSGPAIFYETPSQSGLGSLQDRPNVSAEKVRVEVELRRIDDIVGAQARPISFIKMDIEGAELAAMRGATRVIAATAPVIVFEFDTVSSSIFGYDAEAVLAFMERIDYVAYDVFGHPVANAREFEDSLVWIYIALPIRYPHKGELFDRLRRYVREAFGVTID